jgi:hypothetical protein
MINAAIPAPASKPRARSHPVGGGLGAALHLFLIDFAKLIAEDTEKWGKVAIRMLRFLIDPAGTPNAVAASAMALLVISSVSAGGTRSRPCSLLIPPASAP